MALLLVLQLLFLRFSLGSALLPNSISDVQPVEIDSRTTGAQNQTYCRRIYCSNNYSLTTGKLSNQASTLQTISKTYMDLCVDACGANVHCKSVKMIYKNDRQDSIQCTLLSKTLEAQGINHVNNYYGAYYADLSCYRCNDLCQLDGFYNGDFEASGTNPYPWSQGWTGNATTTLVSPGANGSMYALNATLTGSEYDIQQNGFQWCIGTNYTIGFQYYIPSTSTLPTSLELYAGYDTMTRILTVPNPQSGTWIEVSATYIAKQSPQGMIDITFYSSPSVTVTVLFDNIFITPT